MGEILETRFDVYAGRCELWHCVTYARLKMSAGPGGNPEENSQVVEVSDRIM